MLLPYTLEDYLTRFIPLYENSPKYYGHINRYCLSALKHGRPLSRVMIVLYGQPESGKSTTINALFNDFDSPICSTNYCQSETAVDLMEFGKVLTVHSENPIIDGTLSFVDLPVSHGTDADIKAKIRSFKETSIDLKNRINFSGEATSNEIRNEVYPNLMLVFLRSNYSDATIQRTLASLSDCPLVDTVNLNLIVVVTFAMHLSSNYIDDVDQMRHRICEVLQDTLGLANVPIVFVENKPADIGLSKEFDCDFYQLPDGQYSHENLMEAMAELLNCNKDYLGILLTAWYFHPDCQERSDTSSIIYGIPEPQLDLKDLYISSIKEPTLNFVDDDDICILDSSSKSSWKSWFKRAKFTIPPKTYPAFVLNFIGHGYCPKFESARSLVMYDETSLVDATIARKRYRFPNCIKVTKVKEKKWYCLTQETKDDYEYSRANSYGLGSNFKFVVDVEPNGRWLMDKNRPISGTQTKIFEIRLGALSLEEPNQYISSHLSESIKQLPEIFDPNDEVSVEQFEKFFEKWGSHYICKSWIGGSIEVSHILDTSIKGKGNAEINFGKSAKTEAILTAVLDCLKVDAVDGQVGATSSQKTSAYSVDQKIYINGGKTPEALQSMDMKKLKNWIKSLHEDPIELELSFQLEPYHLLDVAKKHSPGLRMATLHRMAHERMITRRIRARKLLDELMRRHEFDVHDRWCRIMATWLPM